MVFDPTESPYYKVVVVNCFLDKLDWNTSIQFDICSSESSSWKKVHFAAPTLLEITDQVYGAVWNGGVVLMACKCVDSCTNHDYSYFRYDVVEENLSTARVPSSETSLFKFIQYFGECVGDLLLIQSALYQGTKFTVLNMMDGENCFQWNIKCAVDLKPLTLLNTRGGGILGGKCFEGIK